ncbi:hypothetical protein HGP28_02910 [Vibrio sp. SM6]|uniref:YtkA-like domain-containing protein n=1 Tax=Vibrio agarilyticus TaxID=2726741 RepID=A0A7X8TN73_9VIBR|nr:hypothetical protein [Vibrio agarilyticus]NLS11840.1 hypothetical protein [Vibrio agarilyticus]
MTRTLTSGLKLFSLLLAVVGGVALQSELSRAPQVSLNDYCALSAIPCTQNGVSLRLDSDAITAMTPIQLTVTWPNSAAQTLAVTLKGYEMEMGEPRYKLTKVADGQYQGELLLPICQTGAMTWLGTINDGEKTIYASLNMQ